MSGWRVSMLVLLGSCAAALGSGCGGARQDAHEPSGTFTLELLKANFPFRQVIARPTSLEIEMRNAGQGTAPNVAVTVDSFYYTATYPKLAANKRPVWVVERGPGAIASAPVESQAISPPGGGQTAYVNTWALGPLAPGQTKTFVWHVVPVQGGIHRLHYSVAAGLAGKAKAVTLRGRPVGGELVAEIAPAPPPRHVNPATGQVVPGAYPIVP